MSEIIYNLIRFIFGGKSDPMWVSGFASGMLATLFVAAVIALPSLAWCYAQRCKRRAATAEKLLAESRKDD